LAHWYVFRGPEDPLGPWTTEAVAESILAGTLEPTTLVAAPGGTRWLRACDVPVLGRLLDGSPTRRGVQSAVLARAPDTHRTPPPEAMPAESVEIRVARAAPLPASLSYYGGGDTLESAGNERTRRPG